MPRDVLADLAQRMKTCRSGVAFFGLGLSRRGLGHHNVEALLRLVTDLNRYTRFYARRMRLYGDVTGADSVLCWQTGYPFSVNLGRGYPRFNPGEFSVEGVLERQEVDACVIVGSETLEQLSSASTGPSARDPHDHPRLSGGRFDRDADRALYDRDLRHPPPGNGLPDG